MKIETNLPGSGAIYSDYEKLKLIISNIVSNACKYTNQGKIIIGLNNEDSQINFFVKDSGIGIPKNEINKIFDRFYRASNVNKGVIGGTGLGLSIAKELVALLNGKIWAESTIEKGSTFYVSIPIGQQTKSH